ncbi:hypothetical protein DID75_02885 [Candidatus Marinamargulisbacteria bacterium SCGC AG-410-N11]|nr:hypothetical protein DID75_02885 [Candidatus Marinamargulisbacteria bacterium SCGC AG-410-N11]
MLEKYFGFTDIHDEYSVLDSLLEHTRIDEEELILLVRMLGGLCNKDDHIIKDYYDKILKINTDSSKVFETVAEQIIQSNFNHQKQYDLIRTYQRINDISAMISVVAKSILILSKVGVLNKHFHKVLLEMGQQIIDIHKEFYNALTQYQADKHLVIKTIHRILESDDKIKQISSNSIEVLYDLANKDELKLGDFRATEHIFEGLEKLSFSVKEAGTSLEWMLIY